MTYFDMMSPAFFESGVRSCFPLVEEKLIFVEVRELRCGVSYCGCYFGVCDSVQVFLDTL